jgi:hypothetical protein
MSATVPLPFKTPRKPLETCENVALFHVRSHPIRIVNPSRRKIRKVAQEQEESNEGQRGD